MAERGIGFVGDITSIQPGLIRTLVEGDYIPVVASVAADFDGQALNVNADIAAGEVSPSIEPFVQGRDWAPIVDLLVAVIAEGRHVRLHDCQGQYAWVRVPPLAQGCRSMENALGSLFLGPAHMKGQ